MEEIKNNKYTNNAISIFNKFLAQYDNINNEELNRYKRRIENNFPNGSEIGNKKILSYDSKISNKLFQMWRDFYLRNSIEYKMFMRYIKEHNLYEKFKRNTNYEYHYNYYFLETSFSWVAAKEGWSFWDSINIKWTCFFDKLKK